VNSPPSNCAYLIKAMLHSGCPSRGVNRALSGAVADEATPAKSAAVTAPVKQRRSTAIEFFGGLDLSISNRSIARAAFDREFAELSRTDETMRSLLSIPGVGVINSTAIAAAIGDGSAFTKGRDFAAWLGLAPRQATTGGKPRLVGITKRGSSYLRILLIHVAARKSARRARTLACHRPACC